ncbi:MAG: signal peptidase II [Clostridia bacterium]|nr:signal peptidase II [Clostridia bacterium]
MKIDFKKLVKKRTVWEYVIPLLIIIGGIAIDQLTKWLAVKYLEPVNDVPIIEGVLHLHFHKNDGAAFGAFSGQPYIFNTLSVIIIIGMSFYLFAGHAGSTLSSVASAMIISGGIGNMIDRVLFGEVTDFIYFKLIDFAIFNGADSFVCVGAGLLILSLILEIVKEEREKRKNNDKSCS